MWHAEFKLMLYPVSECKATNKTQKLLSELNIIADQLQDNRYKIGDNFLSHFTFMGCSPDIELEPQDDGTPYCYIEIEERESEQFVFGSNLKKAKCTHCKEVLTLPIESSECINCLRTLDLSNINWRKTAFAAKNWITVGNIYELEAIPNDQLLARLETLTGVKWKACYIRNETSFTI